ncbi:MAG: DegT/DnrJ/EryC1/StrS family aminotransferase [Magnetococcales bacterium]|nr:DegT/DnrJ/EryC1/StrS family aminotransferase [Magnetococcales bacterium]
MTVAQQHQSEKKIKVPYIDMPLAYQLQREAILARVDDILSGAKLILRQETQELEEKAAKFLGVKYAVGVGNGSDAIYFALKAAGINTGDEVITVAHTFVATLAAIKRCGAKPVLVDIGPDFNMDPALIEKSITSKTRGIMPVHLNGRCCDMTAIDKIAKKHDLVIVEDAAQAFGASLNGVYAGGFGAAGAFSFHPMKVLACSGDGGLVTTDDEDIAQQIKLLRNHGQDNNKNLIQYGYNSRLDNLQAAILLERLQHLDKALLRRREVASMYDEGFSGVTAINSPPPPGSGPYHDIFSSYVICHDNRDELAAHLTKNDIMTFSHWSPPVHKQEGLKVEPVELPVTEDLSNRVLSLPIYPEISNQQVEYVIAKVTEFCESSKVV